MYSYIIMYVFVAKFPKYFDITHRWNKNYGHLNYMSVKFKKKIWVVIFLDLLRTNRRPSEFSKMVNVWNKIRDIDDMKKFWSFFFTIEERTVSSC